MFLTCMLHCSFCVLVFMDAEACQGVHLVAGMVFCAILWQTVVIFFVSSIVLAPHSWTEQIGSFLTQCFKKVLYWISAVGTVE